MLWGLVWCRGNVVAVVVACGMIGASCRVLVESGTMVIIAGVAAGEGVNSGVVVGGIEVVEGSVVDRAAVTAGVVLVIEWFSQVWLLMEQ